MHNWGKAWRCTEKTTFACSSLAAFPLDHHSTSVQADSCYLFQIMDCGPPANFLFRALCATLLSLHSRCEVSWLLALCEGGLTVSENVGSVISVLAAERQEVLLASTGPNKGLFVGPAAVGVWQRKNTQFVISNYLGVITEDLPQHLQFRHTVCLCCAVRSHWPIFHIKCPLQRSG